MRERAGPMLALMIVALLTGACKGGTEAPSQSVDVGKRFYENRCASCHGDDGAGDTPMAGGSATANLTDGQWTYGGNPRDIERTISEGVPGTTMRGFKSTMTPDEIGQLAAYVKGLEVRK